MTGNLMKLSDAELDGVSGGKYTGPTFVYTMEQKDDLYELATRYGTTLRVLLELNNLRSLDQLKPGMQLLFPQK